MFTYMLSESYIRLTTFKNNNIIVFKRVLLQTRFDQCGNLYRHRNCNITLLFYNDDEDNCLPYFIKLDSNDDKLTFGRYELISGVIK